MTQPLVQPVESEAAEPALPNVPVLSYLTQISSPTRVRIVASRGVMAFAWLELLLLVVCVAYNAWRIYYWYDHSMAFLPGAGAFRIALEMAARRCVSTVLLVPVVLFYLLSMQLTHKAVLRGSINAATYVRILLWPLMPFWAIMAVVGPLLAIAALDLWARHPEPRYSSTLWALCFPIGILTLLLVRDLCSLLRWIALNPATEKPPVPFLPVKPAPAIPSA